jgi:hypothetical protein
LLKLPQLEKLDWESLYQKHEVAIPKWIELERLPELSYASWEGSENTKVNLEHFLRSFCTHMFDRKNERQLTDPTRIIVDRARYHKIIMYASPGADRKPPVMDAHWAIDRYAEEVFPGAVDNRRARYDSWEICD